MVTIYFLGAHGPEMKSVRRKTSSIEIPKESWDFTVAYQEAGITSTTTFNVAL
jgi:hypothetical protein